MIQTSNKSLTLDEFLQLPETKPTQEYINGQILQKPMPQGKHSRIQAELIIAINAISKPQKIAYAFPELRCTFGERSIVPDVVVLRWSRIPCDKDGDIANICLTYPDWTIEILSPNQNQIKVMGNILYCLNHGTYLGWLIDPETKSILVFLPQQQPLFLENSKDNLPVPEFLAELKLTVGDIFNWLKL
ncbi:Uma2 family endonuclease [Crocosphaera sp. XPORK-15E]|uniref:Uma2 family endonuclease n=1 Tax=Crocosphaera sp. XPORK-15E TaxID=3110247 RepID=UPI002B1FD75C|nr:Uma2 family endonuclease [Crocosphaera sp. XPORK-15E]MEA5536476.1 Uma2 family endonuclease [Crocosphaera sp. XPORK-15E]